MRRVPPEDVDHDNGPQPPASSKRISDTMGPGMTTRSSWVALGIPWMMDEKGEGESVLMCESSIPIDFE